MAHLLIDVYSLVHFEQREESASYEFNQLQGFWSPEDYFAFVNSFKYEDEKVVLDKYTIIEATGMREVYNWLQCFSENSLRAELEGNGFKVKGIFSDVAGTPFDADKTEFAVVATRA